MLFFAIKPFYIFAFSVIVICLLYIIYITLIYPAIRNSIIRKKLTKEALTYNKNIIIFKNRKELNSAVRKNKKNAGLILFKASRKSALEKTIEKVFPLAYKKQRINYLLPIIKWRVKVVLNWKSIVE